MVPCWVTPREPLLWDGLSTVAPLGRAPAGWPIEPPWDGIVELPERGIDEDGVDCGMDDDGGVDDGMLDDGGVTPGGGGIVLKLGGELPAGGGIVLDPDGGGIV